MWFDGKSCWYSMLGVGQAMFDDIKLLGSVHPDYV